MRAAGFGRIVNMSSRAALGKPDRVVYSATKAGLVGMTRTLAMELGGDGITVNAIGPGPIATDLFRNSNPDGAPQTQRIINSIVVKRLGTPEDVRSEEHTSELQSLMRISYAVFCLKKKNKDHRHT